MLNDQRVATSGSFVVILSPGFIHVVPSNRMNPWSVGSFPGCFNCNWQWEITARVESTDMKGVPTVMALNSLDGYKWDELYFIIPMTGFFQ